MSLADSFRKKNSRPTAGADPARAFGAEELTMEEIRRQNFVPPREKLSGLAQRAGAAIGSLRQKIVGEDPVEKAFPDYREPEPAPRTAAPVYSSRTYQSEEAPELGWEDPFTNPAPKKKTPVRSAAPRSYPSSRTNQGYGTYPEEPYGYGQQYPPRQSGSATQAPAYYNAPASGYASAQYTAPGAGYYPQEAYYPDNAYAPWSGYDSRTGYAAGNGYPPAGFYTPPFPNSDPYGYDPGVRGYTEWSDSRRPPVRRSAPKKAEIGDFKYMFWSVSIVVSMLLTLSAFIYACTV